MRLNTTLNRLFAHYSLTRAEAGEVLTAIAGGAFDEREVAAFLTVFNMRQPGLEELAGFRDAMLGLSVPLDLGDRRFLDVCGTGGDGKDTFNISTLSALVAAAAGVRVAKHGNRSVSSSCGSSNVLEHAGVRFTADGDVLKKQLERFGLCFLHAPLFHPAMARVAPVRQALGVKTFFNMLGPLIHPARPQAQMAGVFSALTARIYYYLLQEEGIDFSVIYDLGGYDEVSLTGPVKVFNKMGEHLLYPEDFGLERADPEALHGGNSVEEAGAIFREILEGRGNASQRNVVCANAGLAIATYFGSPLRDGVEAARRALEGGGAAGLFNEFLNHQEP